MQNRTDSGTPHFSTPQSNLDVSSKQNRDNNSQLHKIWDKLSLDLGMSLTV